MFLTVHYDVAVLALNGDLALRFLEEHVYSCSFLQGRSSAPHDTIHILLNPIRQPPFFFQFVILLSRSFQLAFR